MAKLISIAAMDVNNVIGDSEHNEMPWRLGEYKGHEFWDNMKDPNSFRRKDMAYFQDLTKHGAVIMGRNTYQSIPSFVFPLKDRQNIIVSRTLEEVEGAEVASSIDEALQHAFGFGKVIFMGGSRIYEEAMNLVDEIHVTRINQAHNGDVYFPNIGSNFERIEKKNLFDNPEHNKLAHLEIYKRK